MYFCSFNSQNHIILIVIIILIYRCCCNYHSSYFSDEAQVGRFPEVTQSGNNGAPALCYLS